MADIDFGTGPGTGDNLPTALGKVQSGYKAADAKAATALANAGTNAAAIAALQSGGLPYYNSGAPISTAGTLPTGVIDQWVFITGTGSFPLPAVPSSGAHSFIVTNIGSGDITVGAITLPTGRSVRLYSRNGSWQQFIDVSAGGAVAAKTLSVAFLQPSQNEGNSGTTPFVARFTRTGDTSAAVSFTPTFDPGTTNASDYQGGTVPVPGQQTIAAGATYVDYTITVVGDTTTEPDEAATIALPSSLPTGYSAGTATSATMTIVNDDLGPTYRYMVVDLAKTADNNNGAFYAGFAEHGPYGNDGNYYSDRATNTVTASSTNGGYNLASATDGDPATVWQADGYAATRIIWDMGASGKRPKGYRHWVGTGPSNIWVSELVIQLTNTAPTMPGPTQVVVGAAVTGGFTVFDNRGNANPPASASNTSVLDRVFSYGSN